MKDVKAMLARNTAVADVRFPVVASPKLDGVRGIVFEGCIVGRSGKCIPNRAVTALLSVPALAGLDGELIVGSAVAKDVFRKTSSRLARHDWVPTAAEPLFFYVFDSYTARGGFTERLAAVRAQIEAAGIRGVVLVEQRVVRNADELLAFEEACLDLGFEGLILRDPNGAYKRGRTSASERGMLKLKRFVDAEAEMIGLIEEVSQTGAPKGRMGAVAARDLTTGVVFAIGTGFNDDDRAAFWSLRSGAKAMLPVGPDGRNVECWIPAAAGNAMKYKSFPVGVKNKPRFPVYLGGRESWDM